MFVINVKMSLHRPSFWVAETVAIATMIYTLVVRTSGGCRATPGGDETYHDLDLL